MNCIIWTVIGKVTIPAHGLCPTRDYRILASKRVYETGRSAGILFSHPVYEDKQGRTYRRMSDGYWRRKDGTHFYSYPRDIVYDNRAIDILGRRLDGAGRVVPGKLDMVH